MISLESKQMGPCQDSSKRRQFHNNKHFSYPNRGSKVNKASTGEVTKSNEKEVIKKNEIIKIKAEIRNWSRGNGRIDK